VDVESPQQGNGRFASKPFALQIRLSGRSWWEVMYQGGRTIGEWQTAGVLRGFELPLPGIQARTRWEDLDHSKIVAARLWCPNGQIGEVTASGPNRVFQFKVGTATSAGRSLDQHVLGTLVDAEAGCECWEWESRSRALIRFEASFLTLHERYKVGPFSAAALGLKL
jgi:hypothetical protein